MSRPAEAADAFRTAWLLDPADPDAYRLIARVGPDDTPGNRTGAWTLADLERGLIRASGRVHRTVSEPRRIIDDAGGAMAFVPPPMRAGSFILQASSIEGGRVRPP